MLENNTASWRIVKKQKYNLSSCHVNQPLAAQTTGMKKDALVVFLSMSSYPIHM